MTTRVLLADDHEIILHGVHSILQREPEFEVIGRFWIGILVGYLVVASASAAVVGANGDINEVSTSRFIVVEQRSVPENDTLDGLNVNSNSGVTANLVLVSPVNKLTRSR